jgi:hypothetical protein
VYISDDIGGWLQGLLQQSFAHQNLSPRGGVPVVSQAAQVISIKMLAYLCLSTMHIE